MALYAQNEESQIKLLDAKIDSLSINTNSIQKAVEKLNRLKVSAYIQAQYQHGQQDTTLKIGDKNEKADASFNRFGIRRGRIKFEYDDELAAGAIQLDAGEKGVTFRDIYIKMRDPWTRRSSITAGIFNRPFGHEIGYSTSNLESPERATIIQYFFPDERDLGAMITLRTKEDSPINFLRLDAGLFAGNSINKETDNKKDFIGRLGAEKNIGNFGKWGLGLSYYDGHVFNPTSTAYEIKDKRFEPIDKGEAGTYMRRQYIGMDGQFSFNNSLGRTTLRAEGLLGTQPGTASSSKSPNTGTRPDNSPENALFKRPFLGYFLYLIHDIRKTPFSAVLKYDAYDPNTKLKGEEVGTDNSFTSKTDLAQNTLGIGAIYRFNKNLRIQAYYEINHNEKSSLISGYEKERKDSVFTLRMQYKF
jgi:hypothetical protein